MGACYISQLQTLTHTTQTIQIYLTNSKQNTLDGGNRKTSIPVTKEISHHTRYVIILNDQMSHTLQGELDPLSSALFKGLYYTVIRIKVMARPVTFQM